MPSTGSGERRLKLGKYQVLEHIASGGMGAVYKAVVVETGQEVALKVLSPQIAARLEMRERLRREAEHGAKLSHENIVGFYEFGEAEGTFFLAMEYVHGRNLYDYIEHHGALAPDLARHLLRQIVAALDHIHQLGFIHRDIKPSNILLTRKDGKPLAKLADLGLIRETSDEEFRLTREGYTVGTVDYLAPEQARDSSFADIRSDIYSLGCTLFHMLTGSPPFPDGNLTERLFKHAEVEPADVRNYNPKIPAQLNAVCRRMLAKKPDQRYQTPAELLADLSAIDSVNQASARATAASESALPPTAEIHDATPVTPGQHAASAEFNLAQKAIAAGNLRAGLESLLACCRLDPGQISYRQALREALRDSRSQAMASGWWRRLRTGYHQLLLKAAKHFGKPLQVLDHGEFVLAGNPRDLTAHLLLAEAALACRFANLAKWLLDQAEEVHGPHRLLHRAQALMHELLGDVHQAIAYWELVNRADPDNAEARGRLKDLSARETLVRGHYEEQLATRLPDLPRG